jgi:hypothetical protein
MLDPLDLDLDLGFGEGEGESWRERRCGEAWRAAPIWPRTPPAAPRRPDRAPMAAVATGATGARGVATAVGMGTELEAAVEAVRGVDVAAPVRRGTGRNEAIGTVVFVGDPVTGRGGESTRGRVAGRRGRESRRAAVEFVVSFRIPPSSPPMRPGR